MAQICPESQVTKNYTLRVNRDQHMLPSNLYVSTKLTKFDAVKGTNQTYNCPQESVTFWWVSDLTKWVEIHVEVKQPYLYTNAI